MYSFQEYVNFSLREVLIIVSNRKSVFQTDGIIYQILKIHNFNSTKFNKT